MVVTVMVSLPPCSPMVPPFIVVTVILSLPPLPPIIPDNSFTFILNPLVPEPVIPSPSSPAAVMDPIFTLSVPVLLLLLMFTVPVMLFIETLSAPKPVTTLPPPKVSILILSTASLVVMEPLVIAKPV